MFCWTRTSCSALISDKPDNPTSATRALGQLRREGARLAMTVQNIAEFMNVSTRPEPENGLGLSISEALARVQFFEVSFDLLSESYASFLLWKQLLDRFQVCGKQVHDARLVSVMLEHRIRRILTFNGRHFSRFSDVEALHPDEVLDRSRTLP